MLDALTILRNSQKSVIAKTYENCFKHSGFITPVNADEADLRESTEIAVEFVEVKTRVILSKSVTV